MLRTASADELLRDAREAAGTPNVREAVRDLTLHALRSRPLTASHIASVALAVGRGIASCEVPPTAPVRDTQQGAWAGLEEALGRALLAVELAAREVAEGRAWLAPADRERLVAEITQLERALGEGWAHPGIVPASLRSRIATAARLLEPQPTCPAQSPAEPLSPAACSVLSLVASGVLVGLAELPPRPGGTPS